MGRPMALTLSLDTNPNLWLLPKPYLLTLTQLEP